jgi:hypothetical protein
MILYPPFRQRGVTLAPWLILVPQWARHGIAYLTHEQVHATQQRRVGVLTFWYLYLTDKAFRQAAEVEAYQVQIAAGASAKTCAVHLATSYRLPLTLSEAYSLLTT